MYVYSLQTTIALSGIEGNLLAIFQSLVAISYDTGEMYEYFLTGLIVGDETISLRCVEPLNGTLINSTASYIDKYLYFS